MNDTDNEKGPAVYVEGVTSDAVFGDQGDGDVQAKAAVVLLKCQIALGVLAMPTALSAVGGVPGTLVILGIGLLTTWSDYTVGLFKRAHPEVYSLSDVGFVLAGKVGREIATFMYAAFMIAIVGAGLIPIAIAFNAVTAHATCTVAWVVLGAVVCFAVASIQTLNRISLVSWVGFISIMGAIVTLTVAVGVQDRPADAPLTGPWDKKISAFKDATFFDGIAAISTAIFGYCGTPMFFSVISEMRDPRQFNRSLFTCQSIVISTYITIGVVVYYFCGQYLASPALGSAGLFLKKVTYGIALPGLFASVILYAHLGAKLIFVRILRGSHHLTHHTRIHWATWLGCTGFVTTVGFILAMSIPFFGSLVVLLGALFGTFMCMQINGAMWLHDNWARRKTNPSVGYWLLVALNVFLIVFGTFVQISGTVAGVKSIIDSYRVGAVSTPFSCADNS
ncbi:putative neutral amino acid transporter [Cutaneotrichosporon oleaginosum]|uniref:Putative neutral amino acid transporter n=1 Tax=Cutaneotrichosporon oleaginosum TaxID=879819 RepID=A0A0J0XJM1_9TREE|nr:putative neutral amino acid transporter [Cutaneotrichosporon oleaginosum]KLT41283.1 putative neutral amino acid transporter [Cutaneotrichosporon oleaginosum]